MTAITASCVIELISGTGKNYGEFVIETPNTADTGDTIVIDLTKFGYNYLKHIVGDVHTTENSVVEEEAPTTSVSSGTLTITLGGSAASNYVRVFRVLVK